MLWKRRLHISTAWLCHQRWQESMDWYLTYLPQNTELKVTFLFSFVWVCWFVCQGKGGRVWLLINFNYCFIFCTIVQNCTTSTPTSTLFARFGKIFPCFYMKLSSWRLQTYQSVFQTKHLWSNSQNFLLLLTTIWVFCTTIKNINMVHQAKARVRQKEPN